MNRIKLLVLIAAIALGSLALMACEAETPADDTRIIIDGAGREVVVPKEIKGAVSTWQPMSTIIFSVKGQDKLVGIDNHSKPIPYYNSLYPAIADLPEVGYKKVGVNMETIAAIDPKPDVVFMYSGSRGEPFIEQLELLGIAAVVIDPESAEKVRASTRLIGELLDREAEAEAVIAYYDNTIEKIDKMLNDAGYTKDKRKVTHMFDGGGLLSAPPADYYQGFLLEAAGGIPASKDLTGNGFKTVSAEEFAQWNPEYIFANEYFDGDLREEIDNHKGLSNVKAIQEGNVYRIPGAMEKWDFPGAHSALGMWFMAKIVYPDVFADFDLQAEVEDYYKTYYGKSFTELGGNLDVYLEPFAAKPAKEY